MGENRNQLGSACNIQSMFRHSDVPTAYWRSFLSPFGRTAVESLSEGRSSFRGRDSLGRHQGGAVQFKGCNSQANNEGAAYLQNKYSIAQLRGGTVPL